MKRFITGITILILAGSILITGGYRDAAVFNMVSENLPVHYAAAEPMERRQKLLALTFDDGPKQGTTDVLLEELGKRQVHATFFLIGCQITGNEAIIRQMKADGHQIGCHTYHHVQLTTLSCEKQQEELELWDAAMSQVLETDAYYIRPPFGSMDDVFCGVVDTPIVLWSVDTLDWTGKSAEEIAAYIVREASDGDIILMHDVYAESVKGALLALDELSNRGYTFVTVEELLKARGITPEGGKVYRKAYITTAGGK